jgi:Protein of unknown function (DUF2846)
MKSKLHIRPIILLGLAVASFSFVSCASGPTYAEMKSKLPPIAKGQGRVFVYRPSFFGAAVKPAVKINDQPVGTSEGQGFLYSDQSPGTHELSVTTEWKHKTPVTVTNGQPSYVRCSMMIGVLVGHVMPKQVSSEVGESEMQNCKLSSR